MDAAADSAAAGVVGEEPEDTGTEGSGDTVGWTMTAGTVPVEDEGSKLTTVVC